MHDAGLHAGQRKNRGDGLRKTLQPVPTAIRMSSTPRLRSSFMTFNQNLAPSFCSIQMPSTSLVPSAAMPKANYTALFLTLPSSRIFTRSASK